MPGELINKEALNRRFNPDGSELRVFQLELLEMMKYVVKLCEEHHLTYWLSGGTLLGAYLYQGFIPWDDDVDIDMPLEDYLRFCQIVQDEKRYFIQTKETDLFYPYYYAKIRNESRPKRDTHPLLSFSSYTGQFIDIIPVEKCAPFFKRISSGLLCAGNYKMMKAAKTFPIFRPILHIRNFLNSCFLFIFRLISKLSKKSYYCDTYAVGDNRRHIIREPISLTKIQFEDMECNAPTDITTYLDEWYHHADYHHLPDISDVSRYQHYQWSDSL